MTAPHKPRKLSKVHAKRILNVARALRESVNPEAFDMRKYVWGDQFSRSSMNPVDVVKEKEFCGTPACALGHYAARRDLQKLLKIGYGMTYPDTIQPRMAYADEGESRPGASFLDNALQEHFGITEQESYSLFGVNGCGHAKSVVEAAQFIEKFVAART